MGSEEAFVTIGYIAGAYGVRGWVKINPYTAEPRNMLDYDPWYLQVQGQAPQPVPHRQARVHGSSVIALLAGCEDRDKALALKGTQIVIASAQLPQLPQDEYYWRDLQGLRVITDTGVDLGTVSYLFETGSNDVLVVQAERERLLPYVKEVILSVNLTEGVIRVHWDPEF